MIVAPGPNVLALLLIMFVESPFTGLEESHVPEIIGFPLDPDLLPEREQVTRIYETTRRLSQAGYPSDVINGSVQELAKIPGVTLLTEPDFIGHEGFRCAEWTFGHIYNETWAMRGFTVDTAPMLWSNPTAFLQHHGYVFTGRPTPGCIIAYGDTFPDGRIWLEHFGIYTGVPGDDGQEYVISKFGQGPLVEHPQSVVSTVWGGKYFYIDKPGSVSSKRPFFP
jgi:hypothetical protein